jgi:soluble lytic murein transglycosylase-like protein
MTSKTAKKFIVFPEVLFLMLFVTRRFLMKVIVCFVCVYVAAPLAAWAEPERYDFPAFDRKEKTLKISLPSPQSPPPQSPPPQSPQSSARPSAAKAEQNKATQNEAKRKTIAALLRQYNKKLDDSKARKYADIIIQNSEKFAQNPFVIAAMVVNESSAKHDAVSRGGDYGLMQVRWRVHQKKIKKKYPHIDEAKDMLIPENNVLVGTEIFSNYHATAKKDVRNALMFYSAGNKRLADKVFAVLSQLEKSYRAHLKNS